MFIPSNHLSQSKHNLENKVKGTLVNLIESGASIPNIQLYVRSHHKVNLSYQSIYDMRMNHINTLMNSFSNRPYVIVVTQGPRSMNTP